MKRDMDLIRRILLQVEKQHNDPNTGFEVRIPGRSEGEVSYHLLLLNQAGLVKALHLREGNGEERWRVFHLTWQGHDLLDTLRVNSRIKRQIKTRFQGQNRAEP
jgi:hypothetical protein